MSKFWFNIRDPLYRDYVHLLDTAYWRGYSVVELSRLLAHNNATNIYRVLREEGTLPSLVRQAQKHSLTKPMLSCFKAVGLGFPQWCNSHGIEDFKVAAAALREGDMSTPDRLQVLKSFRIDFRNAFELSFPMLIDTITVPPPPPSCKSQYIQSVIVYDTSNKCFNVTLPGINDTAVTFMTSSHARMYVKQKCALLASISKLSNLPERI